MTKYGLSTRSIHLPTSSHSVRRSFVGHLVQPSSYQRPGRPSKNSWSSPSSSKDLNVHINARKSMLRRSFQGVILCGLEHAVRKGLKEYATERWLRPNVLGRWRKTCRMPVTQKREERGKGSGYGLFLRIISKKVRHEYKMTQIPIQAVTTPKMLRCTLNKNTARPAKKRKELME